MSFSLVFLALRSLLSFSLFFKHFAFDLYFIGERESNILSICKCKAVAKVYLYGGVVVDNVLIGKQIVGVL